MLSPLSKLASSTDKSSSGFCCNEEHKRCVTVHEFELPENVDLQIGSVNVESSGKKQ